MVQIRPPLPNKIKDLGLSSESFFSSWAGFSNGFLTETGGIESTSGGFKFPDASTLTSANNIDADTVDGQHASAFAAASHAHFKSSLDKIMNIRGVTFARKDRQSRDRKLSARRHYGVIAQEIEQVIPEIVEEGKNYKKKVAYMELIPVLIEAVKEQQKTISDLLHKVKVLE